MAGITQSACSFRLRAGRRQWHSVRLRAERTLLIALIALAAACVPRHPVDDLTLSTQVKIELLSDPELGALRRQVSTLDGIVTLSGTVPCAADVDRAKAAAR